MKTEKPHILAEDLVSDDSMLVKLQEGTLSTDSIPEEELVLAGEILRAVKQGKSSLSAEQKELLDMRIQETINKSKKKRNFLRIAVAAVLLLTAGLTAQFLQNDTSDLRRYAGHSEFTNSVNTRMILADEKEIEIESQESTIEYLSGGTEIQIDSIRKLEQSASSTNEFNSILVPFGKRSRIVLSDNSVVWLNSGSKLIYPARFANGKREVFLEGEAIFEVSHDEKQPFMVLTRDLDVQVLGTVFNLTAYPDEKTVNTVLVSGSVQLSYNNRAILGAKKEMMVPGKLAVYDPEEKTIVQTSVNTKNFISWKEGIVVLEKNSLASIVKKLSRYYNVSIEISDSELADETFSGALDLKNSPVQVLELISEILDFEIVQHSSQIIINKKH